MKARQFFSANYQQARQKFLNAARVAGADVVSHENACSGIGGAGLFTDVAALGPAEAENVLVMMSGTHGVEGFAGSAIQTGILSTEPADALGPGVRLVMIHALNPFGFAFLRRTNEDNVDLNRNFVDHDQPPPVDRDYERIASLLAPRSIAAPAKLWASLMLLWFRLSYGQDKLQRVVTQGQYLHPDGLFYGGRAATWSNRALHEIVARHLAGAARVMIIDMHTGLGPYGEAEIIMNDPAHDPAYRRAVDCWGVAQVKSTESGESVSAHLSGTVKLAFARMLDGVELTSVGLEFGTAPPLEVFRALREENWLFHHGREDHPQAARIKRQFLKAFYPDDELWRQKIWAQGAATARRALAALAEERTDSVLTPPES